MLREGKKFDQGHTASKHQCQDLNPGVRQGNSLVW
jgi:hypothetical protein